MKYWIMEKNHNGPWALYTHLSALGLLKIHNHLPVSWRHTQSNQTGVKNQTYSSIKKKGWLELQ